VGAGPAGLYTTKYLLKEHAGARVDVLEALPTPYGMWRGLGDWPPLANTLVLEAAPMVACTVGGVAV
jgi:cation diffusion facilitator CzcD-associated flavoprotein CzcO